MLGAFFFNFSFVLGMISVLILFGAVFFFAGKFLSESPRTWSAAALVADQPGESGPPLPPGPPEPP